MVKLATEKQKVLKVLSKVISIISLVGKILVYVSAPCIIFLMVVSPIFLNKIEVKNDTFVINDKINIEVIEDEKGLTLKYKNGTLLVEENREVITQIKDAMQNHSKAFLIAYIEFSFVAVLATLVLVWFVFMHLRKLFENIYKGDTPFTLENVKHLKRIAYFLIASIILPSIIELIFGVIFKSDLGIKLSTVNIVEILFLLAMAYIFEYGYQIQLDSKAKIYGIKDE